MLTSLFTLVLAATAIALPQAPDDSYSFPEVGSTSGGTVTDTGLAMGEHSSSSDGVVVNNESGSDFVTADDFKFGDTNNLGETPQGLITIKELRSAGTGCPQGTVNSYISPDGQSFTLIFDKFVASLGPEVPRIENYKNCQTIIVLQYPAGYQYSILQPKFRGNFKIETGVTAYHTASYYFTGRSEESTIRSQFNPPARENYVIKAKQALETKTWSPCGVETALNLNREIRLRTTSKQAFGWITAAATDGQLNFMTGLKWRRCQ